MSVAFFWDGQPRQSWFSASHTLQPRT